MEDKEVQTASMKLNGFMEKNRKGVIGCAVVIFVVLIAFIAVSVVNNKAKVKALSVIDEITYELTDGSTALEDAELNTRCETALEKIAAYTGKSGIVGARANMLAADIKFDMGNYADSAEYWKAAAAKGKKTYLEPIAQFNMGVCYEEMKDLDSAAEAYKVAADNKEFVLKAHAKFSYARVLETQSKYAEALAAYKDLVEVLPNDTWANLAKSRIISLETSGKAN